MLIYCWLKRIFLRPWGLLPKLIAQATTIITTHYYLQCKLPTTLIASFVLYILLGGYSFLRVICLTAPRDLQGLYYLIMTRLAVSIRRRAKKTVAKCFVEQATKNPGKTAFIFEDNHFSFIHCNQVANRVANRFLALGYRQGDVIALFMENSPDFVLFWLGLSKIGVIPALINYQLRSEPLLHCLRASKAKAVVYTPELSEAVTSVTDRLSVILYCHKPVYSNTSEIIEPFLDDSTSFEEPIGVSCSFTDPLFYIYTSGTTGLPKAAIISHNRFIYMASGMTFMFGIKSTDILYDSLPLYHSAGGILGVGQCVIYGITVVIRRKFSASNFWKDCIKNKCTVAQYIGEMCRYLLAQPRDPATDAGHSVRVVFGNGLHPGIWSDFKNRFNIQQIGEFYGATEGNSNIVNFTNKRGAIGFTTRILPFLYPVKVVRVSESTGELIRDADGMAFTCEPGEPGMFVGKIVANDPVREFDGYVDKAATGRKVARNVFTQGDSAFLSGDILVMDDLGFFYFKDRTGETFRWKGENVSTCEVEGVLSRILELRDNVVYGVEVPGYEGRAGMVAIATGNLPFPIDLESFYQKLESNLPVFARPLFVRFVNKLETTGTHKLRKVELVKQGFDPGSVNGDPIFVVGRRTYEILDRQVYDDIVCGRRRL